MADQYGKWRVVRRIAESGQAVVYEVEDEEQEERFALKRYKDPNRIDRAKMELEAARRIKSPHVVQVIDDDIKGPKPYIVMPFFPETLATAVQAKAPRSVLLRLFYEALKGVAAAHELQLVHRDLKPENVLISSSDWHEAGAAIADFGLVLGQDSPRLTEDWRAVGSRYYMAPELEEGRLEEVTPTLDVYSLGKILYYLMSGGKVFAREKHRDPEYDLSLTTDPDHLNHFINDVLDRCIVADPADRYPSALEMVPAIEDLLNKAQTNPRYLSLDVPQPCIFCRDGHYQARTGHRDERSGQQYDKVVTTEFALNAPSGHTTLLLVCDNCGHGAWFSSNYDLMSRWLH